MPSTRVTKQLREGEQETRAEIDMRTPNTVDLKARGELELQRGVPKGLREREKETRVKTDLTTPNTVDLRTRGNHELQGEPLEGAFDKTFHQ